jgi:transglutaminase-like putative cysteine protease
VTRKHSALLILIVWAVSMAWLVKRVYFQSTGARLADAALSVQPGATYYRIDVGGTQLGYSSTTLDTIPDSLRVVDAQVIEIPVDGRLHRTVSRSESKLSRALRLESIDVNYAEDGHRYTAFGLFGPDSSLKLAVSDGHITAHTDMKMRRTPVIPSLLPLRLAFGGEMKVGATYDVRLFDAPLLIERDVKIRVAAETTFTTPDSAAYDSTTMSWVPAHLDTTPTFRVDATGGGGPTRIWIDAQGRVVREESASGTVYTRTAFELAVQNFRHRDTVRIKQASAAPRPGLVPMFPPAAPRPAGPEMRVRLAGAPLSAFDLTGDGQTLSGDTVLVRQFVIDSLQPRYRLPKRDTLFQGTLRPEPLIPVAALDVGFPLMRLIGNERDPVKVAALITHWVAQRVRPDTSTLRPEALLSMSAGKGDFDAATILYVTMARSVGIPTRRVAGVRRVGARFYYYDWPEVWLGQWVPVDPVDDQFPADASHLRLMIGLPARRAVMATRLGTLTLEAQ